MKKIILIMFLFLLGISLCACGNSKGMYRTKNSKNDVVKFNDINWLLTKSELDTLLDRDIGSENYRTIMFGAEDINSNLSGYQASYIPTNGDVLFKLYGEDVEKLVVNFVGTNGKAEKDDEIYFYIVDVYFANPNYESASSIELELNKRFNLESSSHYGGIENTYIDENGNTALFNYFEASTGQFTHGSQMAIKFRCADVADFMLREKGIDVEKYK